MPKSAAIADFDNWLAELIGYRGTYDQKVFVVFENEDVTETIPKKRVRICTARNTYMLCVSETYLGCTVSSRTTRAGEDWLRGNDLHDGPMTRETWNRIVFDILRYELVPINAQPQTESGSCFAELPNAEDLPVSPLTPS